MIYKVCLTAKANKVYSEADSVLRKKIAKCLNILQETPKNHPQIKALKGEFAGKYRFRVGDYRVIYIVDDSQSQVIVLLIEHRSQAYR
ncbi:MULTISPECIES: type II toxin-antitoxin system RelE family toxin [Microcystis]|jgi:mRNA interferase RelE/StbE|uniref:RelE/StbE replicon stabilization toxin n=5 Tax=Microcystis TaxID=1125 RepID=A0A0A1VSF1_MICAE|nr:MULTISPECIES: type II toxin-antitoxin system RelE/ParE family toxin [Microcystis]MCA2899968.1 type II toxin-antitoxin system RelE/ParE family toxin [Microcystis sp. M035S1]MCZ8105125.1 type II toxin-antitoxin system RelE/ParE family toxin [Burkholderiales bacterium]NCR38310.1 type II toxin-antitoxin system RelE/ParE family toxin [Microcystis aeruginosa S11-05]NCR51819.1 type II toxin-antitoxin system RelE/ParE family toxin [Microcystis aeruginosa S11-01]REJ47803.1 MAG: type II toxin-antitox